MSTDHEQEYRYVQRHRIGTLNHFASSSLDEEDEEEAHLDMTALSEHATSHANSASAQLETLSAL